MRPAFPDAEAPCGGAGRCGRCRVLVEGDETSSFSPQALLSALDEEETRLLGPENVKAGWRLSCRARFVRPGAVCIRRQEWKFFVPNLAGNVEPSSAGETGLCAAVDIGTTTIACAAADLAGGEIVARDAETNRQRSFGPDVVSRIESAIRDPDAEGRMQTIVRRQVREMLDRLRSRIADAPFRRIHICGNTTMLHIWEGADLAGLSRMPFRPAFLDSRETTLDADGGEPYAARLLPGISAFVGADIAAGILACDLRIALGRPELLVDIGTNGEIVLASGGRLLATATAAGPAFEGAMVSCGLPAVDGAVHRVAWENGGFSFSVLGGRPPAGFCGSGLLDLLASLRRAGLLDENGGLTSAAEIDGNRAFTLPSNPPLRLTQADVRQLQLAKGAIAAGIRILCRHAGIGLAEVGRVHLAGAFGSSLSAESALAVGLLPAEWAGRIVPAGNTALTGTLMTAVNPDALEICARTAAQVLVVDLHRETDFQDAFVDSMRFPAL
jgi:uncharacterized 2Fe-2S/4Fe-4S cluster protein (DUF4445 family)